MRIVFCVSVVFCILKSIHSAGTDSDDDRVRGFDTIFAKLHDLEIGISELRKENRNLRAECTTTSSTNRKEIANANEEIRSFKAEIQSEVESRNKSMQSLLSKNNDLQTEISVLRKDIRTLTFNVSESETNRSVSSASITRLQADVSQNSEELQNMKKTLWKTEIIITTKLTDPNYKPTSCFEIQTALKITRSGVYRIYPIPTEAEGTEVYCDLETDGGGWTVFQSRSDKGPTRVDFYRDWPDYEKGFGTPGNEHWMGLQNLAAMTSSEDQEVRIELGDYDNQFREAKYSEFKVANGSDKYRLQYKNYTGNAGDSLEFHNGMAFTTRDQDNDRDEGNCAQERRGAWWYYSCAWSNLNGDSNRNGTRAGIIWDTWRGFEFPMKTVEMKIRTRGVL